MNLNSLTSGLNPLNLLGGANPLGGSNGIEGGADPLALLSQLFGAANQTQDNGGALVSSSGGGEGGAANSGCSCCQKNDELGF